MVTTGASDERELIKTNLLTIFGINGDGKIQGLDGLEGEGENNIVIQITEIIDKFIAKNPALTLDRIKEEITQKNLDELKSKDVELKKTIQALITHVNTKYSDSENKDKFKTVINDLVRQLFYLQTRVIVDRLRERKVVEREEVEKPDNELLRLFVDVAEGLEKKIKTVNDIIDVNAKPETPSATGGGGKAKKYEQKYYKYKAKYLEQFNK